MQNLKAKVNEKYYREQIITPFLEEVVPRLFPDDNYILHQDSAPGHVSKDAIEYLDLYGVKYLRKDECGVDAGITRCRTNGLLRMGLYEAKGQ